MDAKGKLRRRYRRQDIHTPYERLKALPGAAGWLREGVDFEQLDAQAYARSDNQAAKRLNQARDELFRQLRGEVASAA